MFQLHWQESVSLALLERCAEVDEFLRTAILSAMAEIESKLCDEPEFVGESRDEGHRLLVVDPLAVTYTIDHRGRAVYIVAANVFRTET